jgi:predicted phage terminase large subunit-like protein
MDLKAILPKIKSMPINEQKELLKIIDDLEQAKARETAKTGFIPFVKQMWPGFIEGRHHQIMAEAFERVLSGECKRLIINMAPRHPLAVETPLLTPSGWTTIGEIKVGDQVFGPDGVPTEVVGKSEVHKDRQLYKVTTDDGAEVVCDGDHRWRVRLSRKFNKFHIYTTEQLWCRDQGAILKTLRNGRVLMSCEKDCNQVRAAMLPEFSAVDLPGTELLIDPYVLGVWLGDGTSAQAIITMKDDDAAIIRAEIERRGYKTTDQSTRMSFGILDLKVKLRDLGVLNGKHIPEAYLLGTIQDRVDLVRGLMDTDGCVTKAGQCFFAQKNIDMINDFRKLLWSLGVKNSIQSSEAKIGDRSYGIHHRVSFYMKDCCFLARKRDRTKAPVVGRFIRVTKLDRSGDTVCIKVAREDEAFLAGHGMVATLNTKSEFASYLLPAWFMGNFPEKKIIQSTHTAELAVNFGRKVRNLIDTESYQKIFRNIGLQSDSKAAGRWATSRGGEYFAVGVGGAIAGKGADLFIIDDPHTEQEAILAAHDASVYDKAFEWYTSGPRQRLQPGAAIVIVMCMTGDTSVLLSDGTEKPLSEIRPGDEVATYDDGVIATSRINNWRSSGIDSVFTVLTKSGRIIKANKRHPFLVDFDGERKWVRLESLRAGFMLVATKVACAPQDHKESQEPALPVRRPLRTDAKIPELLQAPSEATGSGKVRSASVESPSCQRASVQDVTTKSTFQRKQLRLRASIGSKTATESLLKSMWKWLKSATTFATSANSSQQRKTLERTGAVSFVLTTATIQEKSGGCSATTVTSRLDTERLQKSLSGRLSTYAVTLDEIVSIEYSGEEEVFDVEVNETENFIANGVVSHNTRWGKRDLTGRLIQSSTERDGTSEWEVIELPAIMPSGNPLWPGYWSKEALDALKSELPASKWNAQYQQQPTNEEGAILKRDWWKRWTKPYAPDVEYVMISADTAYTKNNRSDYSAFTVWGVFQCEDEMGNFRPSLILLDAFKERLEFPALKAKTLEMYREWQPDTLLIEAKASGLPLIHELRSMGVPVSDFTPTRGTKMAPNDKIVRANSVADIISSGMVWAPERKWADEVIEDCAAFPNGANDDLVDSVVMALMRYRQGGLIRLPSDYEEEELPRRHAAYY